jgi:hypothetical protein
MATEPSAHPSFVRNNSALPASAAFEKHYTVGELAEIWGLGEKNDSPDVQPRTGSDQVGER